MLTPFQKTVLDYIRKIPKGKVSTYRLVARAIGKPRAIRAVGTALKKNPWLIKVPCHRVVKSDGGVGNYSGQGGAELKKKLLREEGIEIREGRVVDFKKNIYKL